MGVTSAEGTERPEARPLESEDSSYAEDGEIEESRSKERDEVGSTDMSGDDPLERQLMEAIVASGASTMATLGEIQEDIAHFHERAAAYEQNARALHARIEKLQDDQVRALLKPFFERLATLHAQAVESARRLNEASPESAEDFHYFAEAIENMFSLYDIDSVGATAGGVFDAKLHQAARVVATDDPEVDGTVHRVARQGFIFAGAERVFLPARVSVYRYTPPRASAPVAPQSTPVTPTAVDVEQR